MRTKLKEELKKTKWRYLRENNNRYFDEKRNTALREYLEVIFPDTVWVFDKAIPSELQKEKGSTKPKQFRPDARCEELGLIVEFDGVQHYQRIGNVIKDTEKNEYYRSLKYAVVRIPYFIQLSKTNIKYLFNVDVDDEMCPLKFSFFDSDNDGLEISPGSMCGLGVERFYQEFLKLPKSTKNEIVADLRLVASSHPLDWVVPKQYQKKLLGEW